MKYERSLETAAVRGPPKYSKYAPVWVAGGQQSLKVVLEIRAVSDAHVLLKAGGRTQYEVVIGGWRNSRSEIRRGQQGMPLGSLLHAKAGPLRGSEKFATCTLTIDRTSSGGLIELQFYGLGESIKVFDKKMPKISEIRVATGFGFVGEWRVMTEDDEQENHSPIDMTKVRRNSDTPSIVFPKKPFTAESEANDTPLSAVLRRPPLRTPMSENTRSPFPFSRPQQKSSNALASVRTVLGQFE
jgi:hypothetical protein